MLHRQGRFSDSDSNDSIRAAQATLTVIYLESDTCQRTGCTDFASGFSCVARDPEIIAPIVPRPSSAINIKLRTLINNDAKKNPIPAKKPNLNGDLKTTV
jgi:hypothetical protein